MDTIITINEAKTLSRPIGKVADDKILAFISEVENTIIRKTIGDAFYVKLADIEKKGGVWDHTFDDTFEEEERNNLSLLLYGGIYFDDCGKAHVVTGLKKTIAYYVYALNVRAGDFESTRYGMMLKEGQYSSHISSRERDTAANSATEVANTYLQECIEFGKAKKFITDEGTSLNITSGCIIKKIMI